MVISIIALLVALLLPALSKARESAHSIGCASTLRQMGVAIEVYKTDVHSYPPYRAPSGPDTRYWWFGYANTGPNDIGVPDFFLGLLSGQYLQSAEGAYCPSFGEADPSTGRDPIYSYSLPLPIGGWGYQGNYNIYPSPIPDSAVKTPSQTILLADGYGIRVYFYWPATGLSYYGVIPYPRHTLGADPGGLVVGVDHYANMPYSYKNGNANWLFCDGHVETGPIDLFFTDHHMSDGIGP